MNEGERHRGAPALGPAAGAPQPPGLGSAQSRAALALVFVHVTPDRPGAPPRREAPPSSLRADRGTGSWRDVGGAGKAGCPHEQAVVTPPDACRRAGLAQAGRDLSVHPPAPSGAGT